MLQQIYRLFGIHKSTVDACLGRSEKQFSRELGKAIVPPIRVPFKHDQAQLIANLYERRWLVQGEELIIIY